MPGPTKWSQGFSSANDSNQNDHDGDYQESVNDTAHGVGSDQTQEPQYNQNNSNSVKHNNPNLSFFGFSVPYKHPSYLTQVPQLGV